MIYCKNGPQCCLILYVMLMKGTQTLRIRRQKSNIGTLIPKKVKLSKNTIFAIFTCSLHYKGIKSHTSYRFICYTTFEKNTKMPQLIAAERERAVGMSQVGDVEHPDCKNPWLHPANNYQTLTSSEPDWTDI